jgi:hypothetical protein
MKTSPFGDGRAQDQRSSAAAADLARRETGLPKIMSTREAESAL